ncbi:hypothetical protein VTK26DRAFT_6263 [Humicola hyalothermophila]
MPDYPQANYGPSRTAHASCDGKQLVCPTLFLFLPKRSWGQGTAQVFSPRYVTRQPGFNFLAVGCQVRSNRRPERAQVTQVAVPSEIFATIPALSLSPESYPQRLPSRLKVVKGRQRHRRYSPFHALKYHAGAESDRGRDRRLQQRHRGTAAISNCCTSLLALFFPPRFRQEISAGVNEGSGGNGPVRISTFGRVCCCGALLARLSRLGKVELPDTQVVYQYGSVWCPLSLKTMFVDLLRPRSEA